MLCDRYAKGSEAWVIAFAIENDGGFEMPMGEMDGATVMSCRTLKQRHWIRFGTNNGVVEVSFTPSFQRIISNPEETDWMEAVGWEE